MPDVSNRAEVLWNGLKKLEGSLERWLVIPFYSYFCLIILVEVVRRYILGGTSNWGEMTARYAFVYLVYIAAAEAIKNRQHISVDLIPRKLGRNARLCLLLYFDVMHLMLVGFVIKYSLGVVQIQLDADILMTGLDANMVWASAALPIGWTLMGYRVLQRMLRTCSDFRHGGDMLWSEGENFE